VCEPSRIRPEILARIKTEGNTLRSHRGNKMVSQYNFSSQKIMIPPKKVEFIFLLFAQSLKKILFLNLKYCFDGNLFLKRTFTHGNLLCYVAKTNNVLKNLPGPPKLSLVDVAISRSENVFG